MTVSSDSLKLALVDVVLVLADADRLGIDLDQFGERVLQAARNGDGAAHGEIEIGKLLARDVRGRVDAGAGFADRHGEDAVELRCSRRNSRTKASVSREAVPLPMAMARTLCLRKQRFELAARLRRCRAWTCADR